MATQTLRFPAQTGRTITVDLFPLSSDTATATAISATEATNAKQVYSFTRTSLATSDYLGIIKDSGTAVGYAIWRDVSDVASTFDSDDLCTRKLSATQSGVTIPTVTTLTNAPGDSSGTTTLLSRIVGTLASGTHNPQSGDAYARLGAPAGASVSADVAAVNAKTTNLPATPAATGDIPTANENADALLDRTAGVETNRTLRQALRLMLSALVGKLSGAAGTTVSIRDTNDSKNRIVATVDSSGNRSAVTLDGT